MNNFEVEAALRNIIILVDTRELPTKIFDRRMETVGYPYERFKLDCGDYSIKCTVDGREFSLADQCVIERKFSLDELCMCFGHERKRFEREFERARSNGCRIYLLVEDASWEKILGHKYRSKFTPAALTASILAWMARYDLKLIFCSQLSTGLMIRNILYRELKERLADIDE